MTENGTKIVKLSQNGTHIFSSSFHFVQKRTQKDPFLFCQKKQFLCNLMELMFSCSFLSFFFIVIKRFLTIKGFVIYLEESTLFSNLKFFYGVHCHEGTQLYNVKIIF